MAQTITDFNTFLEDAKEAVSELAEFTKKEEELKLEEACLEKSLDTEQKAVTDAINLTVKKRREEISSSYDAEIEKTQDKLKKIRSKRGKAKNQGIKERIDEETAEIYTYSRELKVRMKTLFQKERVPKICGSRFYYALYFTKGFKETFMLLITLFICFLAIPYGIYMMLPVRKTPYLVGIYFACILIFGGLYTLIGNLTRGRHLAALREGRTIRSLLATNKRKIRVITNSIKKDKNEAVYDLEKYDDDIARSEQDLVDITSKKKEALNTFEDVTKNIITDEITGNSKEKIDNLKADYEAAVNRLRYTETMVQEKKIYITDTYESYVGKEFLNRDRLEALRKILESKEAANISEAIEVYKNAADQS